MIRVLLLCGLLAACAPGQLPVLAVVPPAEDPLLNDCQAAAEEIDVAAAYRRAGRLAAPDIAWVDQTAPVVGELCRPSTDRIVQLAPAVTQTRRQAVSHELERLRRVTAKRGER